MPNYQSGGGAFLPLAGGTLTGNLNIGLNSLIMHAGGKGGIIKGDAGDANTVTIRNIADSSGAIVKIKSLIPSHNITMQATKTVDGVDLSELAANLYKIKVSDGVKVSHTGDMDNTLLKSYTIPGGLIGANGSLSFVVTGYTDGNNDEKNLEILFNGETIVEILQPASVVPKFFKAQGRIDNKNSESAQRSFWNTIYTSETVKCGSHDDAAVDTANNVELEVWGQLSNGADEVAITHFEVGVIPAD